MPNGSLASHLYGMSSLYAIPYFTLMIVIIVTHLCFVAGNLCDITKAWTITKKKVMVLKIIRRGQFD
uniref:Uncharacterized protein n=1 Tax=Arundo donax TaxID=35708 RepID=A0A0A8ZH62_ARUDO